MNTEKLCKHSAVGLPSEPAIPCRELRRFEDRLRARAATLRAEIRGTLSRADHEHYVQLAGQVHDAGDQSIADLLADVNLAEIARDAQEIRDVEAALRRIAVGTYGVCSDCDERVDTRRLEAYPTAKRCLSCQRARERARPAAPPPSL